MTDVINLTKKAFTWSVVVMTIAWSIGLSALAAPLAANAADCPTLEAGDLFKVKGNTAVYLLDADMKRLYFPHSDVYHTWFSDFSGVVEIDSTCVSAYPNAVNPSGVDYRPGSRLVKVVISPEVYAVGPGNMRHLLGSEEEASSLYGANWASLVRDVHDFHWPNYTTGAEVNGLMNGMLVKRADTSDVTTVYVVQDGKLHTVDGTLPAFVKADVRTVASTLVDALELSVDSVTAASLTADPSQGSGSGTPGTPVVTGGNVSVSLAAETPGSTDILSDSGSDYNQANIPFTAVRFTAGSDAVVVKTVKFTRTGIASDSDLGNLYLYDGDARLAEYTSFNAKVVTFSNSTGLFTVPANSSKTVMLRGDLAKSAVTGGKKIGFEVASSDHVVINGGSVTGSFPVAGSQMATAQVTDLGDLYLTGYTTFPATVKADEAGKELWRMTLNAAEQDMELRYMKLTMIGTISTSDVQNLKLEVGGAQVGATANISDDRTVIFDLSSAPIAVNAGQSKIVVLRGDMMGGSGRVFKFSVQRQNDLKAYDTEYGVYVNPTITTAATSFGVVEPETGNGTDVDSGTLTIGVATDSPTGSTVDGGTGVTLAKFTFDASGESVKVTSLPVYCTGSDNTDILANVKVLLNGSQVGSTDAAMTCSGVGGVNSFTFGNTFVVDRDTDSVVTIVADTTDATIVNAATLSVSLNTGDTGNGQGQTTLTGITTTGLTARTLTVRSGVVTVSENSAFGDKTATNPTGTVNAAGARIASFVITAGSGEAADVTQISLADDATTGLASNYQKLMLMHDGVQIGTTVNTLNTTASTYSFTPSTAIRIAAGQQYVVDVYADIKSSAADAGEAAYAPVRLAATAVTATGVNTTSNISSTNSATSLQNAYIAASGNLTVAISGDTAEAAQIVLGSTAVELGTFELTADAAERINVTDLVVSVSSTAGYQGTLRNLRLYKDGVAFGPAVNLPTGAASTGTYYNATFSGLALTVEKNSTAVITVKADVTTFTNGGANGDVNGSFFAAMLSNVGSGSEPVTAVGESSGASITGAQLDMGTSPDLNQVANEMVAYRSKITVAFAGDSPSGSSVGASAQTIAKFVVSNSSNVGNYKATVNTMNFAISNTGISNTATRTMNVYKDSVSASNLLATTTAGSGTLNFADTSISTFTDVDITAGSSKTFVVTLDTSDAGTDDKLSIGLAQGDIVWSDDAVNVITEVDGLPLVSKTLTY